MQFNNYFIIYSQQARATEDRKFKWGIFQTSWNCSNPTIWQTVQEGDIKVGSHVHRFSQYGEYTHWYDYCQVVYLFDFFLGFGVSRQVWKWRFRLFFTERGSNTSFQYLANVSAFEMNKIKNFDSKQKWYIYYDALETEAKDLFYQISGIIVKSWHNYFQC